MLADARRRAVLGGLAKLGYEVRESMSTAWAQEGRLVVRKPNTTDYGVELGGPSDVSRLQVRGWVLNGRLRHTIHAVIAT